MFVTGVGRTTRVAGDAAVAAVAVEVIAARIAHEVAVVALAAGPTWQRLK